MPFPRLPSLRNVVVKLRLKKKKKITPQKRIYSSPVPCLSTSLPHQTGSDRCCGQALDSTPGDNRNFNNNNTNPTPAAMPPEITPALKTLTPGWDLVPGLPTPAETRVCGPLATLTVTEGMRCADPRTCRRCGESAGSSGITTAVSGSPAASLVRARHGEWRFRGEEESWPAGAVKRDCTVFMPCLVGCRGCGR